MKTILSQRRKNFKESLRKKAILKSEEAVKFLYREGAEEVYIFGSVLKPFSFDEQSDIDIAVKGLLPEKRIEAEVNLEYILNGFQYDLIYLEENLRKEIRDRILKEGKLWKY